MVRISVVVPAYNAEKYISHCLESIINQTLPDCEIIVVDDGSVDSTNSLLQEYASRDNRIKVLWQENSGKPSVARNLGIRHSIGEYITFLDADDTYEPDKLQLECELLDTYPDIDVVFSDMYTTNHDLVKDEGSYLQRCDFLNKAKKYLKYIGADFYRCSSDFYKFMSTQVTSLTTQTVMVRATRLGREEDFFPTNMIIGEDLDAWFRLAKGAEILFINKPLSSYRRHPVSITWRVDRNLLGLVCVHTLNYARAKDVVSKKELRLIARKISNVLFDLGYYHKTKNNYFLSNKYYILSLRWRFKCRTLYSLLKANAVCVGKYITKIYHVFN